MEILLAIVMASAVIFFGALISMGNERQRKGIDGLREQVVLWAIQDLTIKRKALAQNLRVENSQVWLGQTASKACNQDLQIQIIDTYQEPQAVFCAQEGGSIKLVFSPLSLLDISKIKKEKHHRLRRFMGEHPLLSLPSHVKVYELNLLNAGTFFDLEMAPIWYEITGRKLQNSDRLWLYQYS